MSFHTFVGRQALIALLFVEGCTATSPNNSAASQSSARSSIVAPTPAASKSPVSYSALCVRTLTKPFIPSSDKQTIAKIVARTPVTDRSRLRFLYLNNEQLIVYLDNPPGQRRTSFFVLNAPGIYYDASRGETHASPP